jgi:hypothetical protein
MIDPSYIRNIRDGLKSEHIEANNIEALPEGLVGLYDKELFPPSLKWKERKETLQFFLVFALAQKEISADFTSTILGDEWCKVLTYENETTEEKRLKKVNEFIQLHSKRFTSAGGGKFRLYHERFRVYILQKVSNSDLTQFNQLFISLCESELKNNTEKDIPEKEHYTLEFLSTHYFISAMQGEKVCLNANDAASLKNLAYDQAYWERQVKASKGFEWSKKMLNEMMSWATKFDEEELIECALNKVDLYHQEQNDAPRIVQLVADGDIETALQRFESFGSDDKESLQRKFILYMLCLMELTLLDSKDKEHSKSSIEKILKHLEDSSIIKIVNNLNLNIYRFNFFYKIFREFKKINVCFDFLYELKDNFLFNCKKQFNLIEENDTINSDDIEILIKKYSIDDSVFNSRELLIISKKMYQKKYFFESYTFLKSANLSNELQSEFKDYLEEILKYLINSSNHNNINLLISNIKDRESRCNLTKSYFLLLYKFGNSTLAINKINECIDDASYLKISDSNDQKIYSPLINILSEISIKLFETGKKNELDRILSNLENYILKIEENNQIYLNLDKLELIPEYLNILFSINKIEIALNFCKNTIGLYILNSSLNQHDNLINKIKNEDYERFYEFISKIIDFSIKYREIDIVIDFLLALFKTNYYSSLIEDFKLKIIFLIFKIFKNNNLEDSLTTVFNQNRFSKIFNKKNILEFSNIFKYDFTKQNIRFFINNVDDIFLNLILSIKEIKETNHLVDNSINNIFSILEDLNKNYNQLSIEESKIYSDFVYQFILFLLEKKEINKVISFLEKDPKIEITHKKLIYLNISSFYFDLKEDSLSESFILKSLKFITDLNDFHLLNILISQDKISVFFENHLDVVSINNSTFEMISENYLNKLNEITVDSVIRYSLLFSFDNLKRLKFLIKFYKKLISNKKILHFPLLEVKFDNVILEIFSENISNKKNIESNKEELIYILNELIQISKFELFKKVVLKSNFLNIIDLINFDSFVELQNFEFSNTSLRNSLEYSDDYFLVCKDRSKSSLINQTIHILINEKRFNEAYFFIDKIEVVNWKNSSLQYLAINLIKDKFFKKGKVLINQISDLKLEFRTLISASQILYKMKEFEIHKNIHEEIIKIRNESFSNFYDYEFLKYLCSIGLVEDARKDLKTLASDNFLKVKILKEIANRFILDDKINDALNCIIHINDNFLYEDLVLYIALKLKEKNYLESYNVLINKLDLTNNSLSKNEIFTEEVLDKIYYRLNKEQFSVSLAKEIKQLSFELLDFNYLNYSIDFINLIPNDFYYLASGLNYKRFLIRDLSVELIKRIGFYNAFESVLKLKKKYFIFDFLDVYVDLLDIRNSNQTVQMKLLNKFEGKQLEFFLVKYCINFLFFQKTSNEKLDRYNRTLNLQWAIDIKNQLPN